MTLYQHKHFKLIRIYFYAFIFPFLSLCLKFIFCTSIKTSIFLVPIISILASATFVQLYKTLEKIYLRRVLITLYFIFCVGLLFCNTLILGN